jgi:methylglutaconyl-CoA hydratase
LKLGAKAVIIAIFSSKEFLFMDTLRLDQDGSVATVTLARPEVHNAFHPTMIAELTDVFSTLAQDDSLRVVVLASEGKSFSAGADLGWMKESINYTEAENEADALRLAQMFEIINSIPKPLIIRVQGAALGGGVGLVACGDVVIASEQAFFGLTEVRLGIIPAAISPFVMAKIGLSQARRYFLTGERFDAVTAQSLELVHQVAGVDQLDDAVNAMKVEMLKGGPQAHREIKALIRAVDGRHPQDVSADTAQRIARVRVGAEAQEGLTAFFEKRKPNWTETS